jgi:hypothetical protein
MLDRLDRGNAPRLLSRPIRVVSALLAVFLFVVWGYVLLIARDGWNGWWVPILAGAFLYAALTGRDVGGRYWKHRAGPLFALPYTPAAQPLAGLYPGLGFGALAALAYRDWSFLPLIAGVGFILGLTRPLFQYRLVAALVVGGVTVGVALARGWQHQANLGWGGIWIAAGLVVFPYIAACWGQRYDMLSTRRIDDALQDFSSTSR